MDSRQSTALLAATTATTTAMDATTAMTQSPISRCADFLNKVGIPANPVELLPRNGFVDGCCIEAGQLYYTAECAPWDLLHEAGHLAILPAVVRVNTGRNVMGAISRAIDLSWEFRHLYDTHDHPFEVGLVEADDTAATAWAWAAGRAIGLNDEQIISDACYNNEGASVRLRLQFNQYFGINSLRRAGFVASVKQYPAVGKWLQDAEPPAGFPVERLAAA